MVLADMAVHFAVTVCRVQKVRKNKVQMYKFCFQLQRKAQLVLQLESVLLKEQQCLGFHKQANQLGQPGLLLVRSAHSPELHSLRKLRKYATEVKKRKDQEETEGK